MRWSRARACTPCEASVSACAPGVRFGVVGPKWVVRVRTWTLRLVSGWRVVQRRTEGCVEHVHVCEDGGKEADEGEQGRGREVHDDGSCFVETEGTAARARAVGILVVLV